MRSSSASSGQERRYVRQLGLLDQDGHEDKGAKQATHNYVSKKGVIVLKAKDTSQNGLKFMKVQDKEAYYNVGIAIRPFTIMVVSLLFLVAFFTITFPIAPSFDSERDLLTTAQQQWHSSSRRAKHMMKIWEDLQETKTKLKVVITNQEEMYSMRSRLLYWEDLKATLESLTNEATNGPLKLGLINYKNQISHELENDLWGLLTSIDVVPHVLSLESANETLTWKDFYPEWIDEEENFEVPMCPSLPMAELEANTTLDVVFVEIPCDKSSDWARDVLRLHLQLGVANAAAKSNSSYVALFTMCPPFPNLFTCKELVAKRGHLWLYKLDLPKLAKKVALPVGSCELAVPLKDNSMQKMQQGMETRREAYAAILHSADMYVCGAIALAHSIRKTGSKRDMVILVDENIQPHKREGLEEAGWIVVQIERIRNPNADPKSYNEWNYSKLRLWQLTSYHKLIFLDSDVLVLRNIDFLFQSEEISASGNSRTVFNSGVMVLEPNNCTFNLLMSNIATIFSYNGGDQGFLNEIFTWWHRLPRRMNFLKHFFSNSQEEFEEKTRLFGMHPPELYVLHFLGYKPWLCFRDYDCSWHFPELHKFASDVAHATWWNLYDTMPHQLQGFCNMSQNQTDILAYEMATSQLSPNPDPYLHWQRNISDPRFLHPS
eukprot:c25155_g1_i1 orf=192-2171(-)